MHKYLLVPMDCCYSVGKVQGLADQCEVTTLNMADLGYQSQSKCLCIGLNSEHRLGGLFFEDSSWGISLVVLSMLCFRKNNDFTHTNPSPLL